MYIDKTLFILAFFDKKLIENCLKINKTYKNNNVYYVTISLVQKLSNSHNFFIIFLFVIILNASKRKILVFPFAKVPQRKRNEQRRNRNENKNAPFEQLHRIHPHVLNVRLDRTRTRGGTRASSHTAPVIDGITEFCGFEIELAGYVGRYDDCVEYVDAWVNFLQAESQRAAQNGEGFGECRVV